jgi:hypothetical protein
VRSGDVASSPPGAPAALGVGSGARPTEAPPSALGLDVRGWGDARGGKGLAAESSADPVAVAGTIGASESTPCLAPVEPASCKK